MPLRVSAGAITLFSGLSPPKTPRASFLDLPYELRIMIYDELITRVPPACYFGNSDNSYNRRIGSHWRQPGEQSCVSYPMTVVLLNHQINAEFMDRLRGETLFMSLSCLKYYDRRSQILRWGLFEGLGNRPMLFVHFLSPNILKHLTKCEIYVRDHRCRADYEDSLREQNAALKYCNPPTDPIVDTLLQVFEGAHALRELRVWHNMLRFDGFHLHDWCGVGELECAVQIYSVLGPRLNIQTLRVVVGSPDRPYWTPKCVAYTRGRRGFEWHVEWKADRLEPWEGGEHERGKCAYCSRVWRAKTLTREPSWYNLRLHYVRMGEMIRGTLTGRLHITDDGKTLLEFGVIAILIFLLLVNVGNNLAFFTKVTWALLAKWFGLDLEVTFQAPLSVSRIWAGIPFNLPLLYVWMLWLYVWAGVYALAWAEWWILFQW